MSVLASLKSDFNVVPGFYSRISEVRDSVNSCQLVNNLISHFLDACVPQCLVDLINEGWMDGWMELDQASG